MNKNSYLLPLIFVFVLAFSLMFYCIETDIIAFDIKSIDKEEIKIEKKEGKIQSLFVENTSHFTLSFALNKYANIYNSLFFSLIYKKLARPPPFLKQPYSISIRYMAKHTANHPLLFVGTDLRVYPLW